MIFRFDMDATLLDIARRYQKATGIGLPFSESDSRMLGALEQSWRETENQLRKLQRRDEITRAFIESLNSANNQDRGSE